jgi:F-type H+-transporting ATPase subunit gamma
MASAHTEIERHLTSLQARRRVIRQEEITAEIIELATGAIASRMTNR